MVSFPIYRIVQAARVRMEILSSRILLHSADLTQSRFFYEELLGLRLYHEYSYGGQLIGVVYFLGGGFLELTQAPSGRPIERSKLWLQVPDLNVEEQRLTRAGLEIVRSAERKPWGLIEMTLLDPDQHELLLVEVPEDHFLRRQL